MATLDYTKILDPFTTILKLALYALNNRTDCLVTIENNALIYNKQTPRGLMNMLFGGVQSTTDLKYLEDPIKFACVKYLFGDDAETMESLFVKALEGLDLLQTIHLSKNNETVAQCVKSYMQPIQYSLIKMHAANQTQATMTFAQTAFTTVANDEIYTNLNTTWTPKHVIAALNLFELANNADSDDKLYFITALNDFLLYFDVKTRITIISQQTRVISVDEADDVIDG